MANPAQEIRNRAQAKWSGAAIHSRGRNWIKHQHPADPNLFMLDVSIGPIHIEGTESEIDTAWQSVTGVWQWEMTQADYAARAKDSFNGAPLVEFSVGSDIITLQPRQIDWTNDRGDVQVAGSVQSVNASPSDDVLRWDNAYGPGRHFEWETNILKLTKKVLVDSYASFPAPTSQVLEGGNPVLSLPFQMGYGNLTCFVDDVEWSGGNRPELDTVNPIEFRKGDGTAAFYFGIPQVYDANNEYAEGVVHRVSKSGPVLLIEIRVPQTWLENASYPVTIDPTIEGSPVASADDGHEAETGYGLNTTDQNVLLQTAANGFDRWQGLFKYDSIALDGTETITSSTYFRGYFSSASGATIDALIYGNDVDSAANLTDEADINTRARTTASVSWAASISGNSYNNSPDISSIITEIIGRAGWSTNNNLAIIIQGVSAGSTLSSFIGSKDGPGSKISILHIEYTTGGGATEIGLNTETDTAQSLSAAKAKATGLNTETDSAQAMTAAKALALALNTETDSVQALSASKTREPGLNAETETALAIGSAKTQSIAVAAETETVFSITIVKTVSVGLVSETDSPFALAAAKTKALGLNSETDAALPVSTPGATVQPVGLVTETDSVFAITPVKTRALGLVSESDTLQALTAAKALALGLAAGTDALFALASAKAKALGLNAETDSAFSITELAPGLLGIAAETDTLFAITPVKTRALGLNTETDSALAVSQFSPSLLGIAAETDTVFTLTVIKALALGFVSEVDSALAMSASTTESEAQPEQMQSKFFDQYFRQRKKIIKGQVSKNSHDIVIR